MEQPVWCCPSELAIVDIFQRGAISKRCGVCRSPPSQHSDCIETSVSYSTVSWLARVSSSLNPLSMRQKLPPLLVSGTDLAKQRLPCEWLMFSLLSRLMAAKLLWWNSFFDSCCWSCCSSSNRSSSEYRRNERERFFRFRRLSRGVWRSGVVGCCDTDEDDCDDARGLSS